MEHQPAAQLVDVKFILSADSDQARTLIWQVLPVMFRDRFHVSFISINFRIVVVKELFFRLFQRSLSGQVSIRFANVTIDFQTVAFFSQRLFTNHLDVPFTEDPGPVPPK